MTRLYPGMKHLYVIAISSFFVTRSAAAAPAQCERWKQDTFDWEILKKPQGYTPTGLEQEQINHVRYNSSALTACRNYFKIRNPAVGNNFEVWPIDSNINNTTVADGDYTSARCVWNADNTGASMNKIDWSDTSKDPIIVEEKVLQREAHCGCTVNGPYTNVPYTPSFSSTFEAFMVGYLHAFPKSLKSTVIAYNKAINGGLLSDAPFDPHQILQKTNLTAPDAAEIDHIIPRTDSQGCICGDPTINNAAVISRDLNGSMSNTSPKNDPNRAKMYAEWVTCPSSLTAQYQPSRLSVRIPPSDDDTDETLVDVPDTQITWHRDAPDVESDEDIGGCSSTQPTSGLFGLVLGLGLVGSMRRRPQR